MKNLAFQEIVHTYKNFIINPLKFKEIDMFPVNPLELGNLVENNNLFDFLCSFNGKIYILKSHQNLISMNHNIKIELISKLSNYKQDVGLIDVITNKVVYSAQIKIKLTEKFISTDKINNLLSKYLDVNNSLIYDVSYPTRLVPDYNLKLMENLSQNPRIVQEILNERIIILSENYVNYDDLINYSSFLIT